MLSAELSYGAQLLTGVSKNNIRVEPLNGGPGGIGAQQIISFQLPTAAVIDMRTLKLSMAVQTFGADGTPSVGEARLPPRADSLIESYSVVMGGITVFDSGVHYNSLCHLYGKFTEEHMLDFALGHPEMVRYLSYVDGGGNGLIPPATLGAQNLCEGYSPQSNRIALCIDKWRGFFQAAPRLFNTALVPPITINYVLASNSVLTSSAGSENNAPTEANSFAKDGALGCTFKLYNTRLNVDVFSIANQAYTDMLTQRMSDLGHLTVPFESWTSSINTHTGATLFSTSSSSLDKIITIFRKPSYATQKAPVTAFGFKDSVANVTDAAGNNAGNMGMISQLDRGGTARLNNNCERWLSTYFQHTLEANPANSYPLMQYTINSSAFPQYQANPLEVFGLTKDCFDVPMDPCDQMSLKMFESDYFAFGVRLNLPNSSFSRLQSGLDTRSMAASCQLVTQNVGDTNGQASVVIYAINTSLLKIGFGRTLEVVS